MDGCIWGVKVYMRERLEKHRVRHRRKEVGSLWRVGSVICVRKSLLGYVWYFIHHSGLVLCLLFVLCWIILCLMVWVNNHNEAMQAFSYYWAHQLGGSHGCSQWVGALGAFMAICGPVRACPPARPPAPPAPPARPPRPPRRRPVWGGAVFRSMPAYCVILLIIVLIRTANILKRNTNIQKGKPSVKQRKSICW